MNSTVPLSKDQQRISRPQHARRQLTIPAIPGPHRTQGEEEQWVHMGHDLIQGGKTRFKKGGII